MSRGLAAGPAMLHPGYDQNYCCTTCGHLNVEAVAELAEEEFLQYMADEQPDLPTPVVDVSAVDGGNYSRGSYVTTHSYREVITSAVETAKLNVLSKSSHYYLAKFKFVIIDNQTQYDVYFYYEDDLKTA